jgi:hypothetical protein
MPDHERCAGCGEETVRCKDLYHGSGLETVRCSGCLWRAPNWEQWDRVMRAARELSELRSAYSLTIRPPLRRV